MIEVSAGVSVGTDEEAAYAALTDLEHATWLPGVTRLRHLDGPAGGVGGRYRVEASMLGRHLEGVLVCTEAVRPQRTTVALEDGIELSITATVSAAAEGCRVELRSRYSVGGGFAGRAVERASALQARREVVRAAERFASQFDRAAGGRG